ncbi:hypothetical protein EB796_013394 [Bugula neritina]|uniref:Uncharacterized protein n=1 Tax=Bugula neritina TaxID=10212 RepID=A0A7J7JPN3_BUGNE|nr:hypothetical protein EB796_013394 [Bugula neritina]
MVKNQNQENIFTTKIAFIQKLLLQYFKETYFLNKDLFGPTQSLRVKAMSATPNTIRMMKLNHVSFRCHLNHVLTKQQPAPSICLTDTQKHEFNS